MPPPARVRQNSKIVPGAGLARSEYRLRNLKVGRESLVSLNNATSLAFPVAMVADLFFPRISTANGGMVVRGRIQNGVVILDADATPPVVDVAVRAAPGADKEVVVDAQRQRVLPIMDRSAGRPDEAMNESFSDADHDNEIYGP